VPVRRDAKPHEDVPQTVICYLAMVLDGTAYDRLYVHAPNAYPDQCYAVEENARLIAAAPTLLAACEAEVAWFDNYLAETHPDDDALRTVVIDTHGKRINMIRAAIAAAKGEA
jgi:hypothetical protein